MASEDNWYGFTSKSDLFNAYVLKEKKNSIFFLLLKIFKICCSYQNGLAYDDLVNLKNLGSSNTGGTDVLTWSY